MNELVRSQSGAVAGARRIRIGAQGSTTSDMTTVQASGAGRPRATAKSIENAVYGYLRAIRTLDRTEVTASEIADALLIPRAEVLRALASLRRKGVKPI